MTSSPSETRRTWITCLIGDDMVDGRKNFTIRHPTAQPPTVSISTMYITSIEVSLPTHAGIRLCPRSAPGSPANVSLPPNSSKPPNKYQSPKMSPPSTPPAAKFLLILFPLLYQSHLATSSCPTLSPGKCTTPATAATFPTGPNCTTSALTWLTPTSIQNCTITTTSDVAPLFEAIANEIIGGQTCTDLPPNPYFIDAAPGKTFGTKFNLIVDRGMVGPSWQDLATVVGWWQLLVPSRGGSFGCWRGEVQRAGGRVGEYE